MNHQLRVARKYREPAAGETVSEKSRVSGSILEEWLTEKKASQRQIRWSLLWNFRIAATGISEGLRSFRGLGSVLASKAYRLTGSPMSSRTEDSPSGCNSVVEYHVANVVVVGSIPITRSWPWAMRLRNAGEFLTARPANP